METGRVGGHPARGHVPRRAHPPLTTPAARPRAHGDWEEARSRHACWAASWRKGGGGVILATDPVSCGWFFWLREALPGAVPLAQSGLTTEGG